METNKWRKSDFFFLIFFLALIIIVAIVGLRFSAPLQPVFTGTYPEANNNSWSLIERIEAACREGRLPPEKCPKHKNN